MYREVLKIINDKLAAARQEQIAEDCNHDTRLGNITLTPDEVAASLAKVDVQIADHQIHVATLAQTTQQVRDVISRLDQQLMTLDDERQFMLAGPNSAVLESASDLLTDCMAMLQDCLDGLLDTQRAMDIFWEILKCQRDRLARCQTHTDKQGQVGADQADECELGAEVGETSKVCAPEKMIEKDGIQDQ